MADFNKIYVGGAYVNVQDPAHEESDKLMHHAMSTLGYGASAIDLIKIYNKIEELEMSNKRRSLDASLTIPTITPTLIQQATLNVTAANATLANNLQMEIIDGTISDSITKSVSGSVATFKFTPSSYGKFSYYLYDSTDNRMSSVKKITVAGGPNSQPTYVASARKVTKTNGDHEYIVSVFAWGYEPSGITFSYYVDGSSKTYIDGAMQYGTMSNGKFFAVGSFTVPKDDFEGKVNVVKGSLQGRTTNITLTNTEQGFTLEEEEGLIDDMLLDEE